MSPTAPSGVQLHIPIAPPGRHTRTSSAAIRSWSGANMQPKVDRTRSKLSGLKGIASASPSTQSTSTIASAARSRAMSSNSGTRSSPTARAPRRTAGIVALPVPQATSSTSIPGCTPARSTSSSAALVIFSATAA